MRIAVPELQRILVANRGEIACRIFRTVKKTGRTAIAVYSDADAGARHVVEADVAVGIGPPPARESYLSIPRLLVAAEQTRADAIHPGYGFLAENADFARAVIAAGLTWIGPPPDAIEAMGDKISAKRLVSAAGVPVVPGRAEPGMSDEVLAAAAAEIGWPVLVKPSAGGGGKGMHVVRSADDLLAALATARREAAAAFGDDTLFVERFVSNPRHIEVQVLADLHGTVLHLGERECSLQRRHQKVVEEAPSPLLDAATRDRIGQAACQTARSVGYAGAGTVEFIVSADAPDEFFFMEMNTRLQVEHPVTEMVTGEDLVARQIEIAEGAPLPFAQDDVVLRGHAVEARVYAEDPASGFLPTSGTVLLLRGDEHVDQHVRVDSGIREGAAVGTDYDPMLAKVIAWGAGRPESLHLLDRALADLAVLGLTTNVGFLRQLLAHPRVQSGDMDTGLIDTLTPGRPLMSPVAYAAGLIHRIVPGRIGADPWQRTDGWRLAGVRAPTHFRLDAGGDQTVEVAVVEADADRFEVTVSDSEPFFVTLDHVGEHDIELVSDGRRIAAWVAHDGPSTWVHVEGESWSFREVPPKRLRGTDVAAGAGELRSPMPGTVIAVPVAPGDVVAAGATIAVVEAMKMEHAVNSAIDGSVAEILVSPGETVSRDQPLARIRPSDR